MTKAKERRFGHEEPRIYTKPLRELTPETSLGFSVISFAEVIGMELYPWQRWLLIHMLELLEDGSLRFGTVVVLVARQNGKSTVSQVLALWFMVVARWPLILGTAQDLETAEETWDGAVQLLEDDDELSTLVKRVNKTNGKKALVLNGPTARRNGPRYKVKAANRGGGRGLSGNLILLDELREHQNWLAWAAITHTTMAQLHSLIVALSNAGDLTSVVLRYLRLAAHKALGDPDGICREADLAGPTAFDLGEDPDEDDEDEWADEDPTEHLAIFEWSTEPGRDRRDRGGWQQSNPSMGHRPYMERNIAKALSEPEWVFRTEVLCQWPDGTIDGPFPPGSWDAIQNKPAEAADGSLSVAPEDRIVGPVWACIDTSYDRSQTYIAIGGRRADGVAQVEIWAGRYGQDWVKDWLTDPKRRDRIKSITGQSKGAPVSALLTDLDADPEFTIPVVPWTGGDLIGASGAAYDAVKDATVRVNRQPPLDVAASTAVKKPLGDGWVVDRQRSPADAAPLVAFIGALWLAQRRVQAPPPPPPPPQAVTVAEVHTDADDLTSVGF